MTRGSWGAACMLVAAAITALGMYAGIAQHDHRAGAVATALGLGFLLAGAALLRK